MTYERQDASQVVIGISAALIAFLVVFAVATAGFYYRAKYSALSAVPSAGRSGSFTNGPDEKIGVLVDYAEVTQHANQRLHTYGWVDREHGIASIPIDRAMELTVAGVNPAPAAKEPGQVP